MTTKKPKPCEFELNESYVIQEPAQGSMKMSRPGLDLGQGVEDKAKAMDLIADSMDEDGFYPNIYYINERGNVDLLEHLTGRSLASWV